jgi:hypothetical protein
MLPIDETPCPILEIGKLPEVWLDRSSQSIVTGSKTNNALSAANVISGISVKYCKGLLNWHNTQTEIRRAGYRESHHQRTYPLLSSCNLQRSTQRCNLK